GIARSVGATRDTAGAGSEPRLSVLLRKGHRMMETEHKDQARERVQWERMLPAEFHAAVAALPVVFLPLGTVEWHGEHNALGLDSLKAHALCVRAARRAGGGVVHPPLYGGMG